jgi:hypothetical protein
VMSSSSSQNATHQRKGVLQYNPLHRLTRMKNHMLNERLPYFERYKAVLTVLEDSEATRQKTKKMKVIQPSAITKINRRS